MLNQGPANFFEGQNFYAGNNQYPNPFFNIPMRWLPLNIDGMMRWADVFYLRMEFYRSALDRAVDYFITSLQIEEGDEATRKKYQEVFEKCDWKGKCKEAGLNLMAYGNNMVSFNQAFTRHLQCPECEKVTPIDKTDDYKFTSKGEYFSRCVKCGYSGRFEVNDQKLRDAEKLIIYFYKVKDVFIRREDFTGDCEYFVELTQDYKKRVFKPNNKFESKKCPMELMDAMKANKSANMLELNPLTFLHQKLAQPVTIDTGGKSIPPCIYMFDAFFMYKTLTRFNEVICFEDIAPFRVFSPAGGTGDASPIMNSNLGVWKSFTEKMVREHKLDPAAYHTFPFPFNYQQLGGNAKELVPHELMKNAEQNILNSLNIPQEIWTMNLQTQAAPISLRLFENAWNCVPRALNEFLQFWADIIAKIQGWQEVRVSMKATTLINDIEKKNIMMALAQSNSISKSTLLEAWDLSYSDEVKKVLEEQQKTEETKNEMARKQQLEQASKADMLEQGGGITPMDADQEARQLAEQIVGMQAGQARTALQEIKATDQGKYALVKQYMEEIRSQARSQGNEQMKQQAQGEQ